MDNRWEVTKLYNKNTTEVTVHVWPLGDTREHASTDCWCKPRVEEHEAHTLYVHNAADGREAYEQGERKPN